MKHWYFTIPFICALSVTHAAHCKSRRSSDEKVETNCIIYSGYWPYYHSTTIKDGQEYCYDYQYYDTDWKIKTHKVCWKYTMGDKGGEKSDDDDKIKDKDSGNGKSNGKDNGKGNGSDNGNDGGTAWPHYPYYYYPYYSYHYPYYYGYWG